LPPKNILSADVSHPLYGEEYDIERNTTLESGKE
jgi:hypothetical protein